MSILREVFVKLGLEVDDKSFTDGHLAVATLKAVAEKAAESITEISRTLYEQVNAVADYGEKISDLSAATGIGTAALQRLADAAQAHGVGIDQLSQSFAKLSQNVALAQKGGNAASDAFQDLLGASANLKKPLGDLFVDLAAGFLKAGDSSKKAADLITLLGANGMQVAGLFKDGRAGLKEFLDTPVMSKEQLEAADQMRVAERSLGVEFQIMMREAIGPSVPMFRDVVKNISMWVQENRNLVSSGLGVFFRVLADAIKGVVVGLDGLIAAAQVFIAHWKSIAIVAASVATTLIAANAGVVSSWIATNAELVSLFIQIEALSVKAALASAAAWIEAAAPVIVAVAPFVALGVAIGLIINDIREFITGGKNAHTVTGALVAKVKELWNWFTNLGIVRGIVALIHAEMFALGFVVGLVIRKAEDLWNRFTHFPRVVKIVDSIKAAFHKTVAAIRAAPKEIKQFIDQLLPLNKVQTVLDAIKAKIVAIGDAFKNSTIGGWIGKVAGAISGFGSDIHHAEAGTSGGFASGLDLGAGTGGSRSFVAPGSGLNMSHVYAGAAGSMSFAGAPYSAPMSHVFATPIVPASSIGSHYSNQSVNQHVEFHINGGDTHEVRQAVSDVLVEKGVVTNAHLEHARSAAGGRQ